MTSDVLQESLRGNRVCAVVVTYRRPAELSACIDALLALEPAVHAVVVVDNGGSEVHRFSGRDRVITVAADSNLGAAGGFALGIERALIEQVEWIYLLNDDDRPSQEAIGQLLRRVRSDRDPGTIGAIAGWAATTSAERPLGERRTRGRYSAQPERSSGRPDYETDACTFSGLLVRVSAIQRVGNVRADFFMMGEEHELCLRLRSGGYRIVVLATPLVHLQLHSDGIPGRPWRGYYSARNSILLLRSIPDRRSTDWLWFYVRQLKFIAAALALPNPLERIAYRLRGIWDGLRGVTGMTVDPG